MHFLIGIALSYLCWTIFFLIGLLTILSLSNSLRIPSTPALDLPIASAVGVALTTICLFVLATVHLFRTPGILCTISLLLIGSIVAARRQNEWSVIAEYFIVVLRSALSWPLAITLIAVSILAAPAALPPTLSDSTMYHLAHAIDWANAGYLRLDQFVRFPLAQFNIELLFATFFALHLSSYVQFVTWIFYAITAAALAILVPVILREAGASSLIADVGGLLTAAAFWTCPIVTQYADVAYVDVPAGAMLLAFAVAMLRAREDFRRFGIAAAMIAGCLIGIKVSLVLVFFLASFLLVLIARAEKVSKTTLLWTIATLLIFAAPWFLRNLALSGDPLDPILNLTFRHNDPFWTSNDFNGQRSDLHRGVFAGAVPILAFFNRPQFIDGVSLSFCFLYVPVGLAVVLLVKKSWRQNHRTLSLLVAIATFGIGEELIATDWLIRYTLHFYPVFLAVLALSTWLFFQWLAKRAPSFAKVSGAFALLAMALFSVPSVGSSYTYDATISGFKNLSLGVDQPETYLSLEIPTYIDATRLSNVILASGTNTNVFTLNYEYLAFYFRNKGVTQIGDWFGPGRVLDFKSALDSGRLFEYFLNFDVGAVMFPRSFTTLTIGEQEELIAKLKMIGFVDVTLKNSQVIEFVRADVLASAAKNGDSLPPTDMGYAKLPVPLVVQSCGIENKDKAAAALSRTKLPTSGRMMKLTTSRNDKAVSFSTSPVVVPLEPYLWPSVTLDWKVPGAKKTEVKVLKATGRTFAFGSQTGSAVTGYWMSLGIRLFLEDTTHGSPGRVVASLSADECTY